MVVVDLSSSGEETVAAISAAGGEAMFVQADVSVEADVEAAVRAAESVYGELDVALTMLVSVLRGLRLRSLKPLPGIV